MSVIVYGSTLYIWLYILAIYQTYMCVESRWKYIFPILGHGLKDSETTGLE